MLSKIWKTLFLPVGGMREEWLEINLWIFSFFSAYPKVAVSCTSTLAPMVRIDVRSATKAQKVCNQSLQYPPVLFKSFLHG